jgi:alanine dehydrogenase
VADLHRPGLSDLGCRQPLALLISTCQSLFGSSGAMGSELSNRDGAGMRFLILGGGVIGTSIAYHLAARGAEVVVLERSAIACAASG